MRKRPNGGHGGAGGNVVIQADDRMQNLANATHHFKGGAGLNGMRTCDSSCDLFIIVLHLTALLDL